MGSLSSSPCLQGERVAFTGTLASMTHAEATDYVARNGGVATEHVSRQTTMLVVGEEGWPLDDDGQPSVKLQQIERWREDGSEIHILSESQWLTLLGLDEHREEVHRLYTPAMLASILGISVHVIRGWERAGLIRPVHRICRLPYFDFREVSSARRLSELLEAGVARRDVEESLRSLPSVQRGDQRPLEQLEILAHHLGVLVRDRYGLLMPANGQRVLDFDPPEKSAEVDNLNDEDVSSLPFEAHALKTIADSEPRDWLVQGCRLYDAGSLPDALEAFRLAAMDSPQSADVHFQIGECLYRMGDASRAIERYYMAAELDHEFLEAWTQIGCLHRELDELRRARDAFLVALNLLPEYPDAHYHLAETLLELGDEEAARVHWQEYLKHDWRGDWADVARERLEQLDVNDEDAEPAAVAPANGVNS